MKIQIEGDPKEIKKLFNAIGGSKKQLKMLNEIKRNTEPLTNNGEKH